MIIDMDKVCNILKDSHGIEAYVEQTGGGTATIYAGEPDRTDPTWPRFPAVAGPGWFEDSAWTLPRADTADFAVGPDDDGESEPYFTLPNANETTVARIIAKRVKKGATA